MHSVREGIYPALSYTREMDVREFWTKFRGTVHFRLLYLFLVSTLIAMILPFGALCFPLLIIPVLMFLVPYWFGERKVRNLAVNGLLVIVLSALVYATILTPMVMAQTQEPQIAVGTGLGLTEGRVNPFWTTNANAPFNFTVNLTATSPDPSKYTVRVQMVDFEGLQLVRRTFEMSRDAVRGNGNLTDGEHYYANTTIPPLFHAFNFQVLTVVNTTQVVVLETDGVTGPFHAPYTTYWGFVFYQGMIGMMFVGMGFFLVLLLYWWTRKARQIRGAPGESKPKKRAEGGGEFTCTNCGADASEEDTTCPKCGASFVAEGEGEPTDEAS